MSSILCKICLISQNIYLNMFGFSLFEWMLTRSRWKIWENFRFFSMQTFHFTLLWIEIVHHIQQRNSQTTVEPQLLRSQNEYICFINKNWLTIYLPITTYWLKCLYVRKAWWGFMLTKFKGTLTWNTTWSNKPCISGILLFCIIVSKTSIGPNLHITTKPFKVNA